MDEATFQLRSAVDQFIAKFERTIESKDAEIARLKSLSGRLHEVIARPVKQDCLTSDYLQSSQPLFPLALSEPAEDHEPCNAKLRQANSQYEKLLEEAKAQARHAKTLESGLEKAQAKNREWLGWFQSTTPKVSAWQKKKMQHLDPTPTGKKAGKTNIRTSQSPSLTLASKEPNHVSIPISTRKNDIFSSNDDNLDRCSSPQLPPYTLATSITSKEPREEHAEKVSNNQHCDSDRIPTSASTEAVEQPADEGTISTERQKMSVSAERSPIPSSGSTASPTLGGAEHSLSHIDTKSGLNVAPISLMDNSSGPAYRPSSFSEGFSFTGVDLDRSFKVEGDGNQRRRKHPFPPCSEPFPKLPASEKRSFSEPPTSQSPKTPGQGQKRTTKFSPLHEIDGNVQRVDRNNLDKQRERPFKKRKTRQQQALEAIPSIAEDGDENFNPRRNSPASKSSARQPKGKRLEDLLEAKSPNYPVLTCPLNSEIVPKTPNGESVERLQSTAKKNSYSSGNDRVHSAAGRTNMSKETGNPRSPRASSKESPKSPSFGKIPTNIPRAWISALEAATTDYSLLLKMRTRLLLESQSTDRDWYDTAEKVLKSHDVPIPPRGERPQAPTVTTTTTTSSSSKVNTDREGVKPARARPPLRSLPPDELQLSDFKINPAKNDGLPYAYTDVVRRRDQRQCLSGCTRPGCCGDKFRALAAADRPHDSTTAASDFDADTILLCNYLGESPPSLNNRLVNALSAAERTRLLTDARTKAAADKFGKMHRQRHARAPTPPGFWDVDMPGTQEMEKERERARERVRGIVRERWVEARRGEGVWVFADE